eukprot:72379_1
MQGSAQETKQPERSHNGSDGIIYQSVPPGAPDLPPTPSMSRIRLDDAEADSLRAEYSKDLEAIPMEFPRALAVTIPSDPDQDVPIYRRMPISGSRTTPSRKSETLPAPFRGKDASVSCQNQSWYSGQSDDQTPYSGSRKSGTPYKTFRGLRGIPGPAFVKDRTGPFISLCIKFHIDCFLLTLRYVVTAIPLILVFYWIQSAHYSSLFGGETPLNDLGSRNGRALKEIWRQDPTDFGFSLAIAIFTLAISGTSVSTVLVYSVSDCSEVPKRFRILVFAQVAMTVVWVVGTYFLGAYGLIPFEMVWAPFLLLCFGLSALAVRVLSGHLRETRSSVYALLLFVFASLALGSVYLTSAAMLYLGDFPLWLRVLVRVGVHPILLEIVCVVGRFAARSIIPAKSIGSSVVFMFIPHILFDVFGRMAMYTFSDLLTVTWVSAILAIESLILRHSVNFRDRLLCRICHRGDLAEDAMVSLQTAHLTADSLALEVLTENFAILIAPFIAYLYRLAPASGAPFSINALILACAVQFAIQIVANLLPPLGVVLCNNKILDRLESEQNRAGVAEQEDPQEIGLCPYLIDVMDCFLLRVKRKQVDLFNGWCAKIAKYKSLLCFYILAWTAFILMIFFAPQQFVCASPLGQISTRSDVEWRFTACRSK